MATHIKRALKIYFCMTLFLIVSQSLLADRGSSENKTAFFDVQNNGNFDRPRYVSRTEIRKTNTGLTSNDFRDVIQYCFVYNDFAFIEIHHPTDMGAESLIARPIEIKKNSNFDEICNKNYRGVSYTISAQSIAPVFSGKYGKFIYLKNADSFGAYQRFELLRMSKQNYERILSGTTKNPVMKKQKMQFFKTDNNTIGLRYWMGLTKDNWLSCSITSKDRESCWKKILKENNIQENLPIPDCEKSYLKAQSPLDNASQVLLHVEIRDLNDPSNKIVIDSQAECYPAP